MRRTYVILLLAVLAAACTGAFGEERFPPPEFTATEYALPSPTQPPARDGLWEGVDIAVLLVALCLSAWLVLRKRSRRGVYALMLFSMAYFGFYRDGCVCPIGGIQNVAQAACAADFVLPLSVLAFFFLPLVFTLIFGRVYCASVCPHGALQDAVVLKPIQVPAWLDHALGLFAYLYLGLAVLWAATGAAYVICEYDPFVPLFRMTGSVNMLTLGTVFLLAGAFVGRPYCRYLCPYGAILRLLSPLSRWKVSIYPDRCIDCRLCDTSCPYGAIRPTTPVGPAPPRAPDRRRLAGALVLLPLLVALCAWLGSGLAGPLARMHPAVQRAETVAFGAKSETELSKDDADRLLAFRQNAASAAALPAEAREVMERFESAAPWFGAWVGLVIAAKLIALTLRRRRDEYLADRGTCVACARCFDYCPGEKGLLDPEIAARARRP